MSALKPAIIAPGKIRIVATSGKQRDPLLKDVTTAKENGFPSYVVTSWNGVGARAGMPAEIVNQLSAAVNRALAALAPGRRSAVGIRPAKRRPQRTSIRN